MNRPVANLTSAYIEFNHPWIVNAHTGVKVRARGVSDCEKWIEVESLNGVAFRVARDSTDYVLTF